MVKSGLIVTYYFPPVGGGGVQRWSKFIKYLSRKNWQFNIITHKPSQNEITDSTLLLDVPDDSKIFEVSDNYSYKQVKFKSNYLKRWLASILYITDSRRNWVKKAWQKISEELTAKKYDVIICSIPPYSVSEIAVKIKEKFSDIPVVLDMRDPWSINPYKIYPTLLHKYLDKRIELKTIKKLDYIISAYQSEVDFFDNKIDEFGKKQIAVISNGFDEDDFKNLNPVELPNPDYFNIAFSGTFYSHLNNPALLFEALALLKKEGQKINFHHVGTSVYDVKVLAKKSGIEDLFVNWGYKNHKECLEILNSMDAFTVILDSKVENADKTIGGKVYEYLRFKKPILGLVPKKGEAAQLIINTNSGLISDSSKIKEIAGMIKKLKNEKFEYVEVDKFSRKNLANILNDYLINII